MITIYVKNNCGCCVTAMKFLSIESAEEEFKRVGPGSSMKIIDDEKKEHDGIDTFYGFSLEEEEEQNKGLGYLASLIGV